MSGKRLISCLAVVQRTPDEVLLIRRRGNGRWTLPGGRLEPQESWCACAIRETEEEAGITLDRNGACKELVMHCKERGGIRIYYFAQWLTYQGELQNREPHLHEELAWFRLDALPENMTDSVRRGLLAVLQGGGIIETGFNADMRKSRKQAIKGERKAGILSRLYAYLFPPLGK